MQGFLSFDFIRLFFYHLGANFPVNRNVTRKLALSLAKKSVSNGFVDINWQFFKPRIVDN